MVFRGARGWLAFAASGALAVLVTILMIELAGCALFKPVARTVIDASIAACIAEHADVEDEPTLQSLCKWTEDLGPIIRDLLAARRRGLARAHQAGVCGPDGRR